MYADVRARLSSGGLDVDDGWRRRGGKVSLQRGGLRSEIANAAVSENGRTSRQLSCGELARTSAYVLVGRPVQGLV